MRQCITDLRTAFAVVRSTFVIWELRQSDRGGETLLINLLEVLSEAWTWLSVCIVQSLTLLAVKLALRVRKSYSRLFSVLVRSTLKSRLFNPPHREPRVTNHAQTCTSVLFSPYFLADYSCTPPHPLTNNIITTTVPKSGSTDTFFFFPLFCFLSFFRNGDTLVITATANHKGGRRRYLRCCWRPPVTTTKRRLTLCFIQYKAQLWMHLTQSNRRRVCAQSRL